MPQFKFTHPYGLDYADGRRFRPGDVVEADVNPDPHNFEEVEVAKKKTETTADTKETN